MTETDVFSKINSCKYLYLHELGEPRDNSLRLVIHSARTEPLGTGVEGLRPQASTWAPIIPTKDSHRFELTWPNYVAYAVRDESFAQSSLNEIFSGHLARVYKKSDFLAYVEKATFAGPDYPGPLTHVSILCLNHIIDVVAVGLPAVVDIAR